MLATFQPQTRRDIQTATEGFGDAFTGRGQSISTAIEALNPFFRHLTPVMRTLADPDTQLDQFFLQLGRAAARVAPVAETQAVLFTRMADTFEAISRNPAALQAAIEKVPTEDMAISSFRVQRPFLADFVDLSVRLRPVGPPAPDISAADQPGDRGRHADLPRTVPFNRDLRDLSREIFERFDDPTTLLRSAT